ncbi:MAG: hypothetical protein HXX17_13710 [Geobacteraceae bacterium]|nr:hypothetical protein [Geobacteraceae bacterium]
MRKTLLLKAMLLLTLCFPMQSLAAQVSIGIGLPNLSIGINLPIYPELVAVPGYPVYYAPQVGGNYFFYDGMYWVYQDDTWYASNWYNGPWSYVAPNLVPVYILRIPVRYYNRPPAHFHGWRHDAPPRWGQHWGHEWERQRKGWDKWNRSSVPARAPLPTYQRQYGGDRYPRIEQQQDLHRQNYRHQSRDKSVRSYGKQQSEQRYSPPAREERHEDPRMKGQNPQTPGGGQYEPRTRVQEQRSQERELTHEPRGQEQRYQERQREPQGQGHGQKKDDDRGR